MTTDLCGIYNDSNGSIRYELTFDTGESLQGHSLYMDEDLPARQVEFTYSEVERAVADGSWTRVQ